MKRNKIIPPIDYRLEMGVGAYLLLPSTGILSSGN